MNWLVITGAFTTICFIVISLQAKGGTYRYSFIFLSLLLWLVFFLRRKLALHPLHFALFAGALLLHDLGSLGFYRRQIFGLEFDLFVHFYFGVIAGLVLYRALGRFYDLAGWRLFIAVALVTLGIGGIHELVEWSTTLVMGPERGMLKLDPNDPFDTQKDLLNNLVGAMLASVMYSIARRRERLRPQEPALRPVGVTSAAK